MFFKAAKNTGQLSDRLPALQRDLFLNFHPQELPLNPVSRGGGGTTRIFVRSSAPRPLGQSPAQPDVPLPHRLPSPQPSPPLLVSAPSPSSLPTPGPGGSRSRSLGKRSRQRGGSGGLPGPAGRARRGRGLAGGGGAGIRLERAASCAAQGQTRQQAPDPQAPARPLPGCRKSFSPLAWYSLTEEEWPAPGWPAPGVRHLGRGWGRPRGRASLSSACRPPLPAFPPPPARPPPHRAVTLPPRPPPEPDAVSATFFWASGRGQRMASRARRPASRSHATLPPGRGSPSPVGPYCRRSLGASVWRGGPGGDLP